APRATVYYVYGQDVYAAMVYAINMNIAPIISSSYGACEPYYASVFFRSFFQQANAQGITFLNSSGDAGSAGCDFQFTDVFATRGRVVNFPAVMPEVTGVGGTQFVEDNDSYWTAAGSARSYIPEAAWNESDAGGIASTGGGASLLFAKPAWQSG